MGSDKKNLFTLDASPSPPTATLTTVRVYMILCFSFQRCCVCPVFFFTADMRPNPYEACDPCATTLLVIGGRRLGQAAGGRATALAYQRHVPVEQKRHHTGQHRAQAHSTNRLGAPTSPSRCSRTFRTRQTRTCSTNVQNTTQPVFVASSGNTMDILLSTS